MGVAQGPVPRRRFPLWHVWIGAMPVLWAIGWVVTTALGIQVERQFTVFGAFGATAFAIPSGLLLLAGMRGAKSASA